MLKGRARSAVKAETLKTEIGHASWFWLFCTFLMLIGLLPMWNHFREISELLGFDWAAGIFAVVTAAAFCVSWWLNTGNE